MSQGAVGRDTIANEPLELLDIRKAPLLLARPDEVVVDANLEDATGHIRGEGDGAELLGKGGQELLRHPADFKPQPHSLQYVISMVGLLGMNATALCEGRLRASPLLAAGWIAYVGTTSYVLWVSQRLPAFWPEAEAPVISPGLWPS